MGLLEAPVLVRARGGDLRIDWHAAPEAAPAHERNWGRRATDVAGTAPVRMSGPAEKVFDGEIELP